MQINAQVIRATAVAGLGGLLFGFDTVVVSGTNASLTALYHLSPSGLGFTVASALIGTVIGALTAGIPGQRLGRRDSLRIMAALYFVAALGCAFAWSWPSLIVFRVLSGLAIGGSSVLGPMYISELSPTQYRGRLVGFFQVNIVVGVLIAYLSNYLIGALKLGATEWRWQLGVAAIPAALFVVALFGIPRSPRWLAMMGRREEALKVLNLIGDPDPEKRLQRIEQEINEERAVAHMPLFRKAHARGIFVAVTVGAFTQFSGINAILYYLSDIFRLSGSTSLSSAGQSVAVGATNLVATLIAMSLIDKIGRKKLLLTGTFGLVICLFLVGLVFHMDSHKTLLVWLLMAYIACFAFSQGAVVWVYISEVFPTAVRAKGQALGSSSHWIFNAIISYAFPVMLRRSSAATFWFFSAMMVLDLVLVSTLYPETSNVSLEDISAHLSH
ncbi:sugar porter family MFS transporter [Terriglobus sp. RCC_193]|uniref:sugar porter family MFS transporter n=1 Tax=Terriglobus sp. RCC_193 TaxID=3239218 RepID=UPI0035254A86